MRYIICWKRIICFLPCAGDVKPVSIFEISPAFLQFHCEIMWEICSASVWAKLVILQVFPPISWPACDLSSPERRYRVGREMSQFGLLPSLLHALLSIRIRVDPHSFCHPESGSVLGMRIRIRIQRMEIDQNLRINLVSCLYKRLLYLRSYVFYLIPTSGLFFT